MSFDSFSFGTQIAANIKALGFNEPTPIQFQAIQPIREKHDLIGLAQTGTGKTAAFVLPMLERMAAGPRRHVRALIIAPTRELAHQINAVIHDLGKHMNIRCTTIYGGVGINAQVNSLRHGVEIVVACPGRLLDHLNRRSVDLSHVEYLVLDEADRLFDMGFLPDIRRILARLPQARQTLLFSATMPPDVRRLAHDILKSPVTVQIAHSTPVASVAHAIYPVHEHLKTLLLLALLPSIERDSVLIFTRTKRRAKRMAEQLTQAGHRAACLQGNLSQNQRQAAMEGFRIGRHRILVATDIAARGIDVSTISHVINYDMPDTVDAYTHRIGRTGRAAKTGDAFTLASPADESMIRAIERVLRTTLDRRRLDGFNYQQAAPPKPAPHGRHARPALPRPAVTAAKHSFRRYHNKRPRRFGRPHTAGGR